MARPSLQAWLQNRPTSKPPLTLPREVLVLIFTALSDLHEATSPWTYALRNDDLRSCALVSRDFNSAATSVLYGSLKLKWRKKQSRRLLRTFLSSHPTLLSRVSSLSVVFQSGHDAMEEEVDNLMRSEPAQRMLRQESGRPRYNHAEIRLDAAASYHDDEEETDDSDPEDQGCYSCEACLTNHNEDGSRDYDGDEELKAEMRERGREQQEMRTRAAAARMRRNCRRRLTAEGFKDRNWGLDSGQPHLVGLLARLPFLRRLALGNGELAAYIKHQAPALRVLGGLTTLITSDVSYINYLLLHSPLLQTLELNGSQHVGALVPGTLVHLRHLRLDTSLPIQKNRIHQTNSTASTLLPIFATHLLSLKLGRWGLDMAKTLRELDMPLLRLLSYPVPTDNTLLSSLAAFLPTLTSLEALEIDDREASAIVHQHWPTSSGSPSALCYDIPSLLDSTLSHLPPTVNFVRFISKTKTSRIGQRSTTGSALVPMVVRKPSPAAKSTWVDNGRSFLPRA